MFSIRSSLRKLLATDKGSYEDLDGAMLLLDISIHRLPQRKTTNRSWFSNHKFKNHHSVGRILSGQLIPSGSFLVGRKWNFYNSNLKIPRKNFESGIIRIRDLQFNCFINDVQNITNYGKFENVDKHFDQAWIKQRIYKVWLQYAFCHK